MSVNTKLTNLANEIREISGTTTKKSLDVMISDISAANDLIDEQGDLIAQLQAAVDSLPEAGGGSGEDVTAEVFEYTNKIASLESAVASLETELANKASGGTGSGSLETCSLTLDFSAKINSAAIGCDIIDENGDAIGATMYMDSTINLVTIENVVCASSLFILYKGYALPGFSCENCYKLPLTPLSGSSTATAAALHTFKITAPNGGNAKITVYNND